MAVMVSKWVWWQWCCFAAVRDLPWLLFTYLLTYLLTPWRRVLLEKLTGFAAN